jgi:hypothetical protein
MAETIDWVPGIAGGTTGNGKDAGTCVFIGMSFRVWYNFFVA